MRTIIWHSARVMSVEFQVFRSVVNAMRRLQCGVGTVIVKHVRSFSKQSIQVQVARHFVMKSSM